MLEFIRLTGYALFLLGCIPRPPGVAYLADLSSALFKVWRDMRALVPWSLSLLMQAVDEDGSQAIDIDEFEHWLTQGKHTRSLVVGKL